MKPTFDPLTLCVIAAVGTEPGITRLWREDGAASCPLAAGGSRPARAPIVHCLPPPDCWTTTRRPFREAQSRGDAVRQARARPRGYRRGTVVASGSSTIGAENDTS